MSEIPETASETPPEAEKVSVFQIFLVLLSIYVLASLFVQQMFELSPAMDEMIDHIDTIVCIIFLCDFFIRLYQAPSKLAFLRWGWIDFVSSLPMLDIFRSGNLFRVVRLFRLLRAFRSMKILVQHLFRNRSRNLFASVATISCLLVMTTSTVILKVEKDQPQSNIKTPSDALWWSIVTVTTVGYGDRYPVTDAGRFIAAGLMVVGVGLFGTFTGFVASMFVEPDIKREELEIHELVNEIRALRTSLETIEEKMKRDAKILRKKRIKASGANPLPKNHPGYSPEM